MSTLRDALADYLTIRRALGYKLEHAEGLLTQFLDHLGGLGLERVSVEQALAWARLPADADVSWWAQRLSLVRGFASYLHTLDPAHQVPPADLLPRRSRRATPYLYSDRDLTALIGAAASLRPPLRAATYQTLIGLLAVTGMRVGEAIHLDRDDLDLGRGVLCVREGKFGKSRELALHASSVQALRAYLARRERLRPRPSTEALLVSSAGARLPYSSVSWTHRRLVERAGLGSRSGSCRPRLHDYADALVMPTRVGKSSQIRMIGASRSA